MALNDAGGLETLDGEKLPEFDPLQNPRFQRMKEIAEAEAQHKKDGVEFVDVADEDHDKLTTAEEVKEEVKEEPKEEPRKMKLKVNGQELELTEDEVIERAQKVEAAEQRFQEAARLRKEAEELRQQQAQPKLEAVPTVDDDDRALARALQMGSEEEAASVIKRLRNSQSGIQPGQIAGVVEMVAAGNQFRRDYPEIFSDPDMTKIALDKDEQLVKSGDRRSYSERYKAIGDELLKKYKLRAESAVTQDKQERKANLQVVPKANVKSAPAGQEDDEGPDNEAYIRQMAKARGQTYVR